MKSKKLKQENIIETEVEETPSVMIRTTCYSNKKTGEFLGQKHEWQDRGGKWHNL